MLQVISDAWHWHPPVGVWIGFLGLLGIVVPLFWEKFGKREKLLWMIMMFALLLLEIKSAYQDRNEHDLEQANARAEQLGEFNRIADGLKTTISGMERIMSEATGGDSYIYFDVTNPSGPTEAETPGIAKGNIWATTIRQFVGTFPIHDVRVSPFCPMGWLPIVDYGTVFPNEIGRPHRETYLQFPAAGHVSEADCDLFITGSNGSYFEAIHFLKQDDKWTWASRLTKYGEDGFKHEFFGPGFPQDHKW